MGRIFEVRKHTMFARWDRMAKQFARIDKDITIAVKAGGTDPTSNPALRRVMQNARAVNMPKDKVEAAIKRARARMRPATNRSSTRATRRTASPCIVESRHRQPDPHRRAGARASSRRTAATSAPTGSVGVPVPQDGRVPPESRGIDQDDLELYLIDHGLEEMGEGSGDKGEPQIVARCLFADFGQHAGSAGEARHHAAVGRRTSTSAPRRSNYPRRRRAIFRSRTAPTSCSTMRHRRRS